MSERQDWTTRLLKSEEVLFLSLEHCVEFLDELIGALLQIVLWKRQCKGMAWGNVVSRGNATSRT